MSGKKRIYRPRARSTGDAACLLKSLQSLLTAYQLHPQGNDYAAAHEPGATKAVRGREASHRGLNEPWTPAPFSRRGSGASCGPGWQHEPQKKRGEEEGHLGGEQEGEPLKSAVIALSVLASRTKSSAVVTRTGHAQCCRGGVSLISCAGNCAVDLVCHQRRWLRQARARSSPSPPSLSPQGSAASIPVRGDTAHDIIDGDFTESR